MFDWGGGRTSEMSAVGLLLAALQGIDIKEMLVGAALMNETNRTTVVRDNPTTLLALCWYWATDGVVSKEGRMGTSDEETRRYFKHSSVQVLICPCFAGTGHSWAKKQH